VKKKSTFRPKKKPFILLAFFIFLVLVGIAIGESDRVLEQAKAICLSCIGIG
jgi:hypothetical protein